MFELSSQKHRWLTAPQKEFVDEDYARMIDSIFEKNDMFMYGARMIDIMDRLKNNALCILGFSGLVMGVGTMMMMNSSDIIMEQCVSFARGREDSYDVEDINTYYGIIFNHLHENTPLRKNFLQWLFLVLETTEKMSPSHVLSSRLLSLSLFIQMVKMMR
jgi:hypothetical protein